MIFVDATEGVSGDMFLAAMMGLLGPDERQDMLCNLQRACERRRLGLELDEVEEEGERGLRVSYYDQNTAHPRAVYAADAVSALTEIEEDIGSLDSSAREMLETLLEAEAEAHNVSLGEVHLHELGRTQALVNLAGMAKAASLLLKAPQEEFACSEIITGSGFVDTSHGRIDVPPPVSRLLLKGMMHLPGDLSGERATPTGIVALKVLCSRQSEDPPMPPYDRSVGFGTRRFGGRLGRTVLVRVPPQSLKAKG